jgi:hypothetical protein
LLDMSWRYRKNRQGVARFGTERCCSFDELIRGHDLLS